MYSMTSSSISATVGCSGVETSPNPYIIIRTVFPKEPKPKRKVLSDTERSRPRPRQKPKPKTRKMCDPLFSRFCSTIDLDHTVPGSALRWRRNSNGMTSQTKALRKANDTSFFLKE